MPTRFDSPLCKFSKIGTFHEIHQGTKSAANDIVENDNYDSISMLAMTTRFFTMIKVTKFMVWLSYIMYFVTSSRTRKLKILQFFLLFILTLLWENKRCKFIIEGWEKRKSWS